MSTDVHESVVKQRKPREKWVSNVPAWAEATPHQRKLLEAAWRAGDLSFLLTPTQQKIYRKIRAWEKKGRGNRKYALDSGRRIGKSFTLIVIVLEDAIRNADWRIVYCAPTYDQVREITLPAFNYLLRSCPPALRPEWRKTDYKWEFPGKTSHITVVGFDKHPDAARGTGVDKVIIDEAGFFLQLEYLVVSIITPQMLGRDHARIIAASTPPPTPLHYWSTTFVPACINKGAHDKRILDEADQYSEEEIEEFYAEMPGGRNGVAARREYRAEHIADESLAIIPEFREVKDKIVKEVQAPVWRDCYVALDPGFHDLSFVLFAYWWFEEQKLVIEDEVSAARMNSGRLAARIRTKETALWGGIRRRGSGEYDTKPQPYLRVSDRDPRLLADLQIDHGLNFIPTAKDNLLQQVDRLRVAVQLEKVIIHPRCVKLSSHLEHGIWKKIGKEFARENDREHDFGHFDGIAALVYLWRNVQPRRNPVPKVERFVCMDLPANDNNQPRPLVDSRWARDASKWRRQGHRYFIRSGRTGS